MSGPLPAGSVAIGIIGKDINFQQIINQSAKSIKNFQQTVGLTKFPGCQGVYADFRDLAVTLAAADHVIRRAFGTIQEGDGFFLQKNAL